MKGEELLYSIFNEDEEDGDFIYELEYYEGVTDYEENLSYQDGWYLISDITFKYKGKFYTFEKKEHSSDNVSDTDYLLDTFREVEEEINVEEKLRKLYEECYQELVKCPANDKDRLQFISGKQKALEDLARECGIELTPKNIITLVEGMSDEVEDLTFTGWFKLNENDSIFADRLGLPVEYEMKPHGDSENVEIWYEDDGEKMYTLYNKKVVKDKIEKGIWIKLVF